ncbi:MAG: hypothetical protein J6D03_06235 [Clostridia bacterium]|nr:hypothetical protein [Clostridia bacterium]
MKVIFLDIDGVLQPLKSISSFGIDIEKTSVSYSNYEAVIELKYISKEKAKEELKLTGKEKEGLEQISKEEVKAINKEKLISQAKQQLARYLEDKRLSQRENLKKYIVMFIGFEEAIVQEI